MGDRLNSSAPPSPSNSDQKSSMPMLYYGLVVVGTAAIVLTVYNLFVIKRCGRRRYMQSFSQPGNGVVEGVSVTERRSLERSLSRNLLSSFKYKKEAESEAKEGRRECDDSCAVCLSGFEEGEEVRKLPRCNHWFHAVCIDMWLYSHFDCPICRTPVVPAFSPTNFSAMQNSGNENNGVAVSV